MAHDVLLGPIVAGIGPDGSGAHAAHPAAGLAERLHVAVVLVFGYDLSQLGPRGGPLEEQLEVIAGEVAGDVHRRLTSEFPSVEISVGLVRDRPFDSLLRAAAAFGAQMIVVGHGGTGPLRAGGTRPPATD